MKDSTNMKLQPSKLALITGFFLLLNTPAAQARFDYNNWQPTVGNAHSYEDALEVRLNSDYKNGFIDSNEMAMLRRDLDGIQAQEDEFRMDHAGLGIHDRKCLADKLKRFDQNLLRAESDKFGLTIASR